MRIATAALNQTPLDWHRNADNIRRALEWVRKQDTMVVAFPELCISGVGCGALFKRRETLDRSLDIFFELLPELRGMIVTLGLPLEYEGVLLNTVCLVVDGKPFGFQCRTNYALSAFRELAWFRPWMRHRHVPFELNGETYKLGDLSFQFQLNESRTFHVAIEVGEPNWHQPIQAAAQERQKLDLLFNPAASAFALEKHAKRIHAIAGQTTQNDYTYIFSNYVGNESGPVIYDGGSFIMRKGKLLAETPRFSYHDAQVVIATIDDAEKPNNNGTKTKPVAVSFAEHVREEEFSRGVSLGMLDYLQKSKAKGFALSLSGGADSAAVAALTALGIHFAVNELGIDEFKRRFKNVAGIDNATTVKELVHRMLLCFYQATRNSSETTRNAARAVAEEVGAEYLELDIDSIVEAYKKLIGDATGHQLDWQTDGIALQNIQARARGPSGWLLANLRSLLLLTTGNRSEATVGYCTMDGDTCGVLAPLGGIDKHFLRQYLRWLETTGPTLADSPEISLRRTMPAMKAINDQAPTAELCPLSTKQTDENDLMPYDLLNRFERFYLVERKTETETLLAVKNEFGRYTDEQLSHWLAKFIRLVSQNNWKRRRYAISFDIDDTALPREDFLSFPLTEPQS